MQTERSSERMSPSLDREPLPRWDYVSSGERLTARLEKELTYAAQRGDGRARDRILSANIPLVVSIARQYSNPHLETEDLIQEGMIGLCTAVDRFDPEKGFRFSTYATYWIKQRVLRALDRGGRLIRVPVDVGYAARKAQQLREELTESLGREPSLSEIAPHCGVSEQRLKAVLECLEEPLSLDASVSDEADPLTLDVADHETPNPEQSFMVSQENAQVAYLLQTLPERDRMVLVGRFGINGQSISLAELADRLKMTREGVRQIQRRALLKLRRKWVELQLQGY